MSYLKVKALRPDAFALKRAHPGDSGLDLKILERTVLHPDGDAKLILHGLALELPEGFEAQVRPRSSTLLKRNLLVPVGTIDSTFRGEIGTVVKNLSGEVVILEPGDYISQLVIAPVCLWSPEYVTDLTPSLRDCAGWGSSSGL